MQRRSLDDDDFDIDEDDDAFDGGRGGAPAMGGRGGGGGRGGAPQGGASDGRTLKVINQPYDEALALSDTGSDAHSFASPSQTPRMGMGGGGMSAGGGKGLGDRGDSPPATGLSDTIGDYEAHEDDDEEDEEEDDEDDRYDSYNQTDSNPPPAAMDSRRGVPAALQPSGSKSHFGAAAPTMASSADFDDRRYDELPVTAELRDLFKFVKDFHPQVIELETPLRPFIQEYIPAVGDLDAFLRVPRPDGKDDSLGLAVLDEPSSQQSDPSVLELELVQVSKKGVYKPQTVRSVETEKPNELTKRINAWVESITELHKAKPLPVVHYKQTMPNIDDLMQIWPAEFEDLLHSVELPSAELDVDVEQYARIVCNILDIPVSANVIESLHVLFTLYSEFKANAHFGAHADV